MDLTDRIKEFRSRQRNVLSWMFTSMLPQRVVVVCGSRLTLLMIGQVLVRQQILCAAITTETEGEAALKAHQPGLLVVADPLEEGDAFNLCRKARQQQPNVKILLILSKENAGSAFQEIDALVDSAIYELDIDDGDDYPLVKAFMAILRAGRYRSPSLLQPLHGIDVPPALEPEQPSSEPQLTPREQEVLDLIGRGLSDRQIGTSLGLSYETARTYVKTVRRKLGSNNRLAAAAWYWRR